MWLKNIPKQTIKIAVSSDDVDDDDAKNGLSSQIIRQIVRKFYSSETL